MKAKIDFNDFNYNLITNTSYHFVHSVFELENIYLKRFFNLVNNIKCKLRTKGEHNYISFTIKLSEHYSISIELTPYGYYNQFGYDYVFWNDKPIAKRRCK